MPSSSAMPCVAAVAWRWAYGAAPLLNLQVRWESVYSVEFRVWGLRVYGLGFRVESVGYGITMRQISIYSELQGMNYLVVDFFMFRRGSRCVKPGRHRQGEG